MNIVVVVVIMGILAIPISKFLANNLKTVTRENLKVSSQEELRGAMDQVERDMFALNQVDFVSQTSGPGGGYSTIQFRMDSDRSPLFPAYLTAFGTTEQNPDIDGDANVFNPPAGTEWQVGYNVKDDDDNNDGRYDVLCRYFVDNQRNLVRQCLYDVATSTVNPPWVTNNNPNEYQVVAKNISVFRLTYFGTRKEDVPRPPPANPANTPPTTLDQGSPVAGGSPANDGIIDEYEMDWNDNGATAGNRNGVLDGNELNAIYTIHIQMAQDKNRDGVNDFFLESEVAPPFLPLKRRP